jgi:hypothetical protein
VIDAGVEATGFFTAPAAAEPPGVWAYAVRAKRMAALAIKPLINCMGTRILTYA